MAPRQDKPPKDYLRIEDRILWETVAKTATPLAGKKSAEPEDWLDLKQSAQKPQKPPMPGTVQAPNNAQEPKKPRSAPNETPLHNFDPPTHRKISKGRVQIEARIDLHGLTQNEAHELLYGFLLDAHARGLKHVMIITGKGRSFGSAGILRQAVPHWFSTPMFRLLVSAYEDAARHHGGDGALYVRLRRQNRTGGLK
ncbi:DNA mismatch repair protein MutS [Falsochrobactrum shanghaiense]|uniref:DNA mismatch repair protein MutS n=1 Tax=Falsochrobactrum shanghaiense TaxID=2201899 RepID=A0A316JWN1_9HYPH|nr:Smr/MutS family protein [Falsochrobactrum shanghaiense]PWL19550.1 DNA mismatch repair protein MutS [Falsochrobactrum shanghaiense]